MDPFGMIAQSSDEFNPLLGRAWAFHERLLATRIVHFADHELVWECKQTQRCECMHLDRSDGRPMMERSTDNIKVWFSQMTGSRESTLLSDPHRLWARVVEEFCERGLRFEEDRLPALAGAVQQMQRLNVGPYIAGIFLNEIPRCLLWNVPKPGVRHEHYTAPTWSWASVVSPARQPPRARYVWHHSAAALRTSECAIEKSCIDGLKFLGFDDNATEGGPSKPTALRFRGPLISATLTIETFDEPRIATTGTVGFDYILHGPPVLNYTYSVTGNEQNLSFLADILLHEGHHLLASGSQIFLMAIAQRFNKEKADNLLVLKRLEDKSDFARYSQIGVALCVLREPAYERIGSANNFTISCKHKKKLI
jgi:hypothetical protein